MRTAAAAVRVARAQRRNVPNLCLRNVRTWWDLPARYPAAALAWRFAKRKHPGDRTPPEGAPVFFAGGAFGHVALATGQGHGIVSTDRPRRGVTSETTIADIEHAWGYRYLGWTGDLSGQVLPLDR